MNVSFEAISVITTEGDGFIELTLLKTEGGVGPVTVTLIPVPGSAESEWTTLFLTELYEQMFQPKIAHAMCGFALKLSLVHTASSVVVSDITMMASKPFA